MAKSAAKSKDKMTLNDEFVAYFHMARSEIRETAQYQNTFNDIVDVLRYHAVRGNPNPYCRYCPYDVQQTLVDDLRAEGFTVIDNPNGKITVSLTLPD